ncbi:RNA-directed DNA polymerase [Ornithinimicrobium sp. Arc0846-15]|nr:RNA-directed DNA polymerase [Ornithinimicrobium laminariae]
MKPMSQALLQMLNIQEAMRDEANTDRNLVPNEPGWDRLVAGASQIEQQLLGQLRDGFHPTPQVEALARKPVHGVRPVAYWGPRERVLYRALAEVTLLQIAKPDRSADAYSTFLKAPVTRGYELQRQSESSEKNIVGSFSALESPLKYIVLSDVASFYQFVDHGILREELIFNGANYDAIDALIELISEIQGQSFGLPQLLDASDWLSEVYIRRVERDLLQRGLEAWRFNDDFRIATKTYNGSLRAIEILDSSCRSNGLIISEYKTFTYGMSTYILETLALRQSDSLEQFDPSDVETTVGSYADDFDSDVDSAFKLLQSASPGLGAGQDGLDLKDVRKDQIRRLSRAIGSLASKEDPRAISQLNKLITYAPSLTPIICRYTQSLPSQHSSELIEFFDLVLAETPLNDWQRIWIINTLSALGLLAGTDKNQRRDWTLLQLRETSDSLVRAHAVSALSHANAIPVIEVLGLLEIAPAALLALYADALSASAHSEEGKKAVAAWGGQSKLQQVLVNPIPGK